jgi:hypothetical protein
MRNRFVLLAPLFAISTIANAESTQCAPINSVPFTITASGNYCLFGDLVSGATGAAAAITIAADNVQLDMNGHSLIGPEGSNAGFGVYSIAHRGLRVSNGSMRGFSRGVFITDTLVGFPPIRPSGASTRHEIHNLVVEGAVTGITVVGHFSEIRDNIVRDSAQSGIATGSDYVVGNTGAINILGNRIFNTIAASGSTNPVYAITVGGTGSVVQDNIVSTVRGPGNSAGIYAGGVAVVVSHNRETDLGTGWSVYCSSSTASKVEGNISYIASGNANSNINGCMQPTGYANNNF